MRHDEWVGMKLTVLFKLLAGGKWSEESADH